VLENYLEAIPSAEGTDIAWVTSVCHRCSMRPYDTGTDLDAESSRDGSESFESVRTASATYLKSLGGAEDADIAWVLLPWVSVAPCDHILQYLSQLIREPIHML